MICSELPDEIWSLHQLLVRIIKMLEGQSFFTDRGEKALQIGPTFYWPFYLLRFPQTRLKKNPSLSSHLLFPYAIGEESLMGVRHLCAPLKSSLVWGDCTAANLALLIPPPVFPKVHKLPTKDGASAGRNQRVHLQLWDTAGQERSVHYDACQLTMNLLS